VLPDPWKKTRILSRQKHAKMCFELLKTWQHLPSRWLPDVPQKFIILKRIASFKYFLFLFKGF